MEIYDNQNIFKKIINGTLPAQRIYENDDLIVIKDINPKAKLHVLFIPKVDVINFSDFIFKSEDEMIIKFFKKIKYIAEEILGIKNYQIITNNGKKSGQEVMHFHVHLLSNE